LAGWVTGITLEIRQLKNWEVPWPYQDHFRLKKIKQLCLKSTNKTIRKPIKVRLLNAKITLKPNQRQEINTQISINQ
jgi:hypothetical protein